VKTAMYSYVQPEHTDRVSPMIYPVALSLSYAGCHKANKLAFQTQRRSDTVVHLPALWPSLRCPIRAALLGYDVDSIGR
jgi:hypothetical protein